MHSNKSRLELWPGVWLDARRAIFLEKENLLAVADLHLGYAWAHRYHGQMLPIHAQDDLLGRLSELCSSYNAARVALLGDIVHHAVPVKEIAEELTRVLRDLGGACGLKLILGNHDKQIKSIAQQAGNFEFLPGLETADFHLVHGDQPVPAQRHRTIVMGHEHPAISLGDGIKSAKFPCFLVAETLLVLPAFSIWSAGSDVRTRTFLSPMARAARFKKAVAICGGKLLPVPLD